MTGRPDWRSSVLLAAAVASIALGTIVAAITIDAPPLPNRRAKVSTVATLTPPPKPAEISLPTADAAPAPTATEFATKVADPPAPFAPTPQANKPNPTAINWASLPIEDLRRRADGSETPAMEELASRLIQGTGAAKDPQAGAGWLLRAAEAGSPQAAFNVGVMYERGFVVERDSSRAVEWYRKAADGNMPAAKHNLALMLRDGKGAPRDVKRCFELLLSAARQGMAASMFALGDMYEGGDAGPKDPAAALAWFAIAAEFERQINRGEDIARTAEQRAQALQRGLTPGELQRAQKLGQTEFRTILEALAPPKPIEPPVEAAPVSPAGDEPLNWPADPAEQVRTIQQALISLQLLTDKPDGLLGPLTRKAIRDFQRTSGLKETGEPGIEVYLALRQAQARRDIVANSPLPPPPKEDPAKAATVPKDRSN
jgi:hypothetical protein